MSPVDCDCESRGATDCCHHYTVTSLIPRVAGVYRPALFFSVFMPLIARSNMTAGVGLSPVLLFLAQFGARNHSTLSSLCSTYSIVE